MNKKQLLLFLFILFSLSSCQVTERFILQETGQVEYSTSVDFSSMLDAVKSSFSNDSIINVENDGRIDTVFHLTDYWREIEPDVDSITPAQQKFYDAMNKTALRMVMDDNEGFMSIETSAKDISSLNDYLEKIEDAYQNMLKEDLEKFEKEMPENYITLKRIEYDGKSFQRIAYPPNLGMGIIPGSPESEQFSAEDMIKMFTYKIEYQFPKKIKDASIKDAQLSLDRKTLTVEVPMKKLMDSVDYYNFNVEFE